MWKENSLCKKIWTLSIPLFFALTSFACAAGLSVKFTNKSGDTISQVVAAPRSTPDAVADSSAAQSVTTEATGPMTVEAQDAGLADQQALAVAQNILAAPVANGANGAVSIARASGACVVDLTFTFASGKSLTIPDMDVCQVDNIVVE